MMLPWRTMPSACDAGGSRGASAPSSKMNSPICSSCSEAVWTRTLLVRSKKIEVDDVEKIER